MFEFTLLSAAGVALASIATAGWIWMGIFAIIIGYGFISSAYEDEPLIWLFPFILLGAIWWGFANPFVWLWLNPVLVFKFAIQYLFIGFIYATFRWWRVVLAAGQYIAGQKDRLLEQFNASTNGWKTFEEYLNYRNLIPYVSKHKAALTRWTLTWFFSAPAFLFHDFFKLVGDFITTFFGGFYTRMRKWTFNSLGIDDVLLNTVKVETKPEVKGKSDFRTTY